MSNSNPLDHRILRARQDSHTRPSSSGLVIPQINTPAEAHAVVRSIKFPPLGVRGQGSPFPAIAHGVDLPTYIRSANETLITCLQIESKAGVENVDAICAVPGVG